MKPIAAGRKLRILGWVRRRLTDLQCLFRQLFPTTVHEATQPLAVLPGHGAEITLDVHGPASGEVHVYAETQRVTGDTAMRAGIAHYVALDETGRGEAVILAAPEDDTATGLSKLRVVAVDPAHPEVDAHSRDIAVRQEGTGALLYTVGGLGIVTAVALQVAIQVFLDNVPFVGIVIAGVLIAMAIAASRADGISLEPWRLLPLRQRWRSAAWAIAAIAIWWAMMGLNTWGENPAELNCDEPGAGACTPGYVLFDNVTAILASLGFAMATMLALAPAIRPRWIAGRMAIVAALFPLMIYDFTLIGYPTLGDGECMQTAGIDCPQDATVYTKAQLETDLSALPPPATGPTETLRERTTFWSDHPAYLVTKGMIASYGGIGWGLTWFGVLFVALRNRSGWKLPAASALLGIGFLASMPTFLSYKLTEGGVLAYTGYALVVAHVFALRQLVGMPGSRKAARAILFLVFVCSAMSLVAFADVLVDGLRFALGDKTRPYSTSLFHTMIVVVLAIVWLFCEAGIVRWLWRRARRRRRAAMAATKPQPG